MLERSLWHPVIAAADLAAAPVALTLLGAPLVGWRDAQGAARIFLDRCPHRGSRLSLGRVTDGVLQCGYHGWRFDGSGRCVGIPALPDFVPPAGHRAHVLPALERYGLVWTRLEEGADAELPAFPAEARSAARLLLSGPFDVRASAPRVVENFLDMAHFGFVHEGWLGDPAHAAIPDYRVAPTATGFVATECQAWQPRASAAAAEGALVRYTYEVTAPYAAVLVKLADDVGAPDQSPMNDAIALFVCPLEEEASRVWFRLAMADDHSSDGTLLDFQRAIFEQDRTILESQTPKRLPLASEAELHCAADRASAAYRRHLRTLGITFGVLP